MTSGRADGFGTGVSRSDAAGSASGVAGTSRTGQAVGMTRALTFEGLRVAAVGLVGDELRLCCTVPRAYARGNRGGLWYLMGSACYGVRVCCTGSAPNCGVAEFSV